MVEVQQPGSVGFGSQKGPDMIEPVELDLDNKEKRSVTMGAYMGYFVLQPIGMVSSFLLTDPLSGGNQGLLVPLAREFWVSFSPETFSCGLIFTLLGMAFGLAYARVVQYPHEKMEKAEHFSHTLETEVRKKTKELVDSQEAIRKAYDELKTIDQLKNDVIDNVSHELKTPITIIQGTLDILLTDETDPKKKEMLHMAQKALDRQNLVVEDLLTASKINRNNLHIHTRNIDVPNLVGCALKAIEPKARERSVDISTNIEPRLSKAMGDDKRLHQVMINLLDNAIKFNRKGGEVRVGVRQSGSEFVVSVSDQGIGITPNSMEKIFKPLTQIDSSINRKYSGTGTGLAVASSIIDAHGGRMWVDSQGQDQGSTFYFTLPAS